MHSEYIMSRPYDPSNAEPMENKENMAIEEMPSYANYFNVRKR